MPELDRSTSTSMPLMVEPAGIGHALPASINGWMTD